MIKVTEANKTALMNILKQFNDLIVTVDREICNQETDWRYHEINTEDEELSTAASEIEQSLQYLSDSLDTSYANYQRWLEDTCGIDTEL